MKTWKWIVSMAISVVLLTSCGSSIPQDVDRVKIGEAYAGGNSFENLYNLGMVANDEQHIYYSVMESVNPLRYVVYKTDLAGRNKTALLGVTAQSMNVWDGWLYYINPDDSSHVYKIDVNGNGNEKLGHLEAKRIYVFDDTLYAIGVYERYNNNIYVMKLDGSDARVLSDQQVDEFFIDGTYLYYTEYAPSDNYTRVGRMRPDGSENSTVFECYESISWFTIFRENIFYVSRNTLYKVALSYPKPEKIADMGDVVSSFAFTVSGNRLFYSTLKNTWFNASVKLHSFNMETGETKEKLIPFLNKNSTIIVIFDYIIGDTIFRNENGRFFVMKLDGSHRRPWGQ